MSATLVKNSLKETSDCYQHHSIRLAQQQFNNAEHALKKTKLKSCTQTQAQLNFRATIYSLNCLYLGNIQPQTRLRGVKHARETSKYISGCLERTSLFNLRRNTQIPDIRTFSIFVIIRK